MNARRSWTSRFCRSAHGFQNCSRSARSRTRGKPVPTPLVFKQQSGRLMGKFNTNLTQQRLLELVHYDPDSGLFTARAKRIHVSVGQTLGSLSNGYVVIRV